VILLPKGKQKYSGENEKATFEFLVSRFLFLVGFILIQTKIIITGTSNLKHQTLNQ